MNSGFKLVFFSLVLVALTLLCKYYFGPIPALSGFSPVLAIALFSGLVVKKKESIFLFPLVSLFVSDLVIQVLYAQGLFEYPGLYEGQWKNYLLLLGCAVPGLIMKGRNHKALIAGAIASPTVYFLVSNFMVWMQSSETFYAKSFSGLITCYTAAIPFYKNSLLATLVFLPVVLLLFNYVSRKKAVLTLA